MTTSCTDNKHPLYNEKFSCKDYLSSFMKNPEKMAYASLGEMLDFISFGGLNFVAYNQGTKELIEITQKWMEAQPKKLIRHIWKDLGNGVKQLKRTIEKEVYLWNKPDGDYREKLPRVNHSKCPRNEKHKGETIKDLAGRVRCSHSNEKWLRPNYVEESEDYDSFSGMIKKDIWEDEPYDPTPDLWEDEDGNYIDWSEEYDEYLIKQEKFDEEEPTLLIADTCYAIIKEPFNVYLPLETVLDRLNCTGFKNHTVHPFSGFTLANFIKAWHNQKGKRKFFRDPNESDSYKQFPNFQPISSDD